MIAPTGVLQTDVNTVKGKLGGLTPSLEGDATVINTVVGGANITTGVNLAKTDLGGTTLNILGDIAEANGLIEGLLTKIVPDLTTTLTLINASVAWKNLPSNPGGVGVSYTGIYPAVQTALPFVSPSTSKLAPPLLIGGSPTTYAVQATTNNVDADATTMIYSVAPLTSTIGVLGAPTIAEAIGRTDVLLAPQTIIPGSVSTYGAQAGTGNLYNDIKGLIDGGNTTIGDITANTSIAASLGRTDVKLAPQAIKPGIGGVTFGAQAATGNLNFDIANLINGGSPNSTIGDNTANTSIAESLGRLDTKIADGSATGNLNNDVATVKAALASNSTTLLGDINQIIGSAGINTAPCLGAGQPSINNSLINLDSKLLTIVTPFPIYQNGVSGTLANGTGQNSNTIPANSANLTTDVGVIKSYVGVGGVSPLGSDLAAMLNRINANATWRGYSPNGGQGWTNVYNAINYLVTNNKVSA